MAEVVCVGCRASLPETSFAIDKMRATGRRYKCRSCSSDEFKRWRATPGYTTRLEKQKVARHRLRDEDPKMRWAKQTKNAAVARAKKKGFSCDITVEWLYANAPDNCVLLSIPLVYNNTASHHDSATLDRKDNEIGYLQGNCWIISMKANRIKTNATPEEIGLLAKNLKLALSV